MLAAVLERIVDYSLSNVIPTRSTPLKRAFTLIELLVVIAIIAILAAILFPVFAQAKLAAKKTAGLSQVKQIGTSTQIYINDYDDQLFPYRLNGSPGQNINPTYQELVASRGQAFADSVIGVNSRNVIFYNQLLQPYIKNNDLWRAPTRSGAWVNYDPSGADTEPPFRSYGGQNSYGVNNYAFTSSIPNDPAPSSAGGLGLNYSAIAEVSNTLLMVDASYYNVLPRYTARLAGSPTTFNPCNATSYANYWVSLGNGNWFIWPTSRRPATATEALQQIDSRYSGVLNVIRADTSAKAYASAAVLNDLRDKGANSMWDPYKLGGVPCGAVAPYF